MTEQSLPRSRRIGLATALALMSTLLVWWRESGAVSSPGLSTGLVLLLVIGIVAIIWMARRSVDGGAIDSNGSPHVTRGMARPRPFSEIPREQRRRLILMIGGTSVAFLLLVPIAAVATMRGASWWQAAPLLPDPATKEQLERLCAAHDVRIRGVRVIHTRHDPALNAAFTGFGPGPKYLFVTDRLLETFVRDEREAVIAHEIGHRKKHHILIKVGAHLGTVALLFAALALLAFFGNGGSIVGIAAFALPVLFIGSLLLLRGPDHDR